MGKKLAEQRTADGHPIVPGMWVWTNELRSEQITEKQFINPSSLTGIDGEFWDGWFQTTGPLQNGERMAVAFRGIKAADWPMTDFGAAEAAERDLARRKREEQAAIRAGVVTDRVCRLCGKTGQQVVEDYDSPPTWICWNAVVCCGER